MGVSSHVAPAIESTGVSSDVAPDIESTGVSSDVAPAIESTPRTILIDAGRIQLRIAGHADSTRLLEILNEPAVAKWWGRYHLSRVERELLAEAEVLVIEHSGEIIGFVQIHEEADPEYRHASLDIALATRHHGRGFGPETLLAVIRHLFDDRGHHRITIDPRADNTLAIAAYSKIGFRPVGVMRQYEKSADGRWHDGLLMDLINENPDGTVDK